MLSNHTTIYLKSDFLSPSQNEPSSESKVFVFRPKHMDDTALWNSFRNGDERALVTIFDRFTKLLYNYGFKIAGESEIVKDSIQELFIELWKNRAQLGETSSIKFYLFKSLRRKLIRQMSKIDRNIVVRSSSHQKEEAFESHEFFLIAEQTSAEEREKVALLLSKLTKRQREAIFLRYYEELGYDKIADIMDLSKQAVYNLISKAIEQLKSIVSLMLLFMLNF